MLIAPVTVKLNTDVLLQRNSGRTSSYMVALLAYG